MPYSLIVVISVIGLTLWYVLVTDASSWSKAIVAGVLIFCLASMFWFPRLSLASLFLMVTLGIFISFYRIVQKSHFR